MLISCSAGMGCFGTFFHLNLLHSKTGVMVLVSCPPMRLSPEMMLLAAGVEMVVSERSFDLVIGKASSVAGSS